MSDNMPTPEDLADEVESTEPTRFFQRIPELWKNLRTYLRDLEDEGDFFAWEEMRLWLPASVVISIFVTFIQILRTYPNFVRMALNGLPLLFVVNIVATVILISTLRLVIRPTKTRRMHMIYVVLVSLSLPTVINTDIDLIKPLGGDTDSILGPVPTSLSLRDLYDPLVNIITREANQRITEEKVSDITPLEEKFVSQANVEKLQAEIERRLALRADLSPEEREAIRSEINEIVISEELDSRTKVRRMVLRLYSVFDRDYIRSLQDLEI